jgi:hypothetical protein
MDYLYEIGICDARKKENTGSGSNTERIRYKMK